MNVGSEEIPDINSTEIEKALNQLKNHRAPVEDKITSEMIKLGGTTAMESMKTMGQRYKRDSGKEMAPDEPIRMEAARGGLCPGVDAKGLLKEEWNKSRNACNRQKKQIMTPRGKK